MEYQDIYSSEMKNLWNLFNLNEVKEGTESQSNENKMQKISSKNIWNSLPLNTFFYMLIMLNDSGQKNTPEYKFLRGFYNTRRRSGNNDNPVKNAYYDKIGKTFSFFREKSKYLDIWERAKFILFFLLPIGLIAIIGTAVALQVVPLIIAAFIAITICALIFASNYFIRKEQCKLYDFFFKKKNQSKTTSYSQQLNESERNSQEEFYPLSLVDVNNFEDYNKRSKSLNFH